MQAARFRIGACLLGALLFSAVSAPCAAADEPFKTIDMPGGGSISYGHLSGQPAMKEAVSQLAQRIGQQLGDRPQLDHLLKMSDSVELGLFHLKAKAGKVGDIKGLGVVMVRQDGPSLGAFLTDDADHFSKSVKAMVTRLKDELGGARAGSTGTQAQAGGPAQPAAMALPGAPFGVSPGGTGQAAAMIPAAMAAASSPASAAAPVPGGQAQGLPPAGGANAFAAGLRPTPLPDGSGVIGLPAGWSIVQAHKGDVTARGTQGETLRFGLSVSVIDPGKPQSRALGGGRGGGGPGTFLAIPFGSDAAQMYKSAVEQMVAKQRGRQPSINITSVRDLPNPGGGRNYFLEGEADSNDGKGPVAVLVKMGMGRPMSMGAYQLGISQVTVPKSLLAQERSTILAIFDSFGQNAGVMLSEIHGEEQVTNQIFRNTMSSIATAIDNSDRMTQGVSDNLRQQTVITDTTTGERARVSDSLAAGLINANPDIQAVPLSEYQRGVDY